MSEAWRKVELGELCDIALGGTPARKTSRFWDVERKSGNVWLSIADIPKDAFWWVSDSKEYLSDEGAEKVRIVKQGTLLFSFKLSIGRVCFAGRDLRTNEAIAALSIKEHAGIDKRYLAWFLWGQDWNAIAANDEKLKGKTLNKGKLKKVPVDLPSLPEQKRIVAILDEAFAGIDTAIANTEKNLANAMELLKGCLNSAFSNESWPKQSLADMAENLDRQRVPITRAKRRGGEIPYYGASGVVDYVESYLFDEELLLVSEDGANLVARTHPIAFSISGKSWVNNHAHVLRFKHRDSQKFVEHYLNWVSLAPYVSGMAQPKLNQKELNSIPIPFPALHVQKEAVDRLSDVSSATDQLISVNRRKLVALRELKQSLLGRAFSGELAVDKAVDQAKEAVA